MKSMNEVNVEVAEAKKIAEDLRACETWLEGKELLERLCELAGLSEEWAAADGEDFELVLAKAGARLGVEIV